MVYQKNGVFEHIDTCKHKFIYNNKTYNNYKVYKINCIKKDIYNLSDRKKLELLQNINLFEKHNDEYIESDNSITI